MNVKRKRLYSALAAALVIAGAGSTALIYGHGSRVSAAEAAAPAAEVDAAYVVAATITDFQSYSGRLEAVDKVDIRPLVPGTIVAVHFKDGSFVKKGDPLFTIDPRPYAAEVDRASAQLAAAQARNGYSATDAARAERLLADNAIAKRDYDQSQNAAHEALANLKAAQAALETAKINLTYTQIVAPVAGRVSRAELTLGNIVSAGASAPLLTTVMSVSPIYASFDVDEQTYLRYLSHSVGQDSKNAVPVALGLADESGYSRDGRVDSVDNRLDSGSGTIRVRARFDNADGALLPGLYARVKVGGGSPHRAVMVDDAAIGTDQDKKFVMVVDAQNKAQYREVHTGNLHDGLRVIDSGMQPGERIIVNGLQRARPNDTVRVKLVAMTGSTAANVAAAPASASATAKSAKAGS
ncbi:efflux RND transporter periplasmic adaptor subunit [Rugamonas sp.]|uniref:efflux RND transporter periplasmic adaptor subunit n=1 Tax=Rugamonas sp. TaxID=1926287 RepID=UPI0025E92A98|nr:efflux RND transporter periplasmic adaptor subunit [Rugamonas sp.]